MSLSQPPTLTEPPVSTGEEIPGFLLPEAGASARRRRGWSLMVSLLAQIAGVALLLWLSRILPPGPTFFYPISHQRWSVVKLEAPVDRVPPPLPVRRLPARVPRATPKVIWRAHPRMAPKPLSEPARVRTPQVTVPAARPGPPQPIATLHPVVKAPPLTHPARRVDPPSVHLGTFGDPQGSRAPAVASLGNVPRYGSFDSGEARQAAAAPASAPRTGGFAALDGPASSGGAAARQRLRINSFDPPPPASSLKPPKQPRPPAAHAVQPPVILSHPRPAYTVLAQRNHVEGDVVLQAILRRDGTVQVLRVVRGLGYGLNQSARVAAQQLRFRPALRDGQPVDWTVLLHITFRLAY